MMAQNHPWLLFQGDLMPSSDLFKYQACPQWVHRHTNRQDAHTHFLKNPFYSWWICTLFPHFLTVNEYCCEHCCCQIGYNSVHGWGSEAVRGIASWYENTLYPSSCSSSGQQKTCFIVICLLGIRFCIARLMYNVKVVVLCAFVSFFYS